MSINKLHKEKGVFELIESLKQAHAFWSYSPDNFDTINEELLIEKVLIHLDINDVVKLNKLFSKKKILKVWKEKLLLQKFMYHSLNRFYAFWLFDIKNPDIYINNYQKNKIND